MVQKANDRKTLPLEARELSPVSGLGSAFLLQWNSLPTEIRRMLVEQAASRETCPNLGFLRRSFANFRTHASKFWR